MIAEDEKNSPWTPFHVQKGFKPEENVVSIFDGWDIRQGHGAKGAGAVPAEIRRTDQQHVSDADAHVRRAGDLRSAGGEGAGGAGIRHEGKAAGLALEEHDAHGEGVSRVLPSACSLYPRALRGEEPYATWYKVPEDTQIPCWPKAADIELVVAGGQTNTFFQVANMNYVRSVSIDKWT